MDAWLEKERNVIKQSREMVPSAYGTDRVAVAVHAIERDSGKRPE